MGALVQDEVGLRAETSATSAAGEPALRRVAEPVRGQLRVEAEALPALHTLVGALLSVHALVAQERRVRPEAIPAVQAREGLGGLRGHGSAPLHDRRGCSAGRWCGSSTRLGVGAPVHRERRFVGEALAAAGAEEEALGRVPALMLHQGGVPPKALPAVCTDEGALGHVAPLMFAQGLRVTKLLPAVQAGQHRLPHTALGCPGTTLPKGLGALIPRLALAASFGSQEKALVGCWVCPRVLRTFLSRPFFLNGFPSPDTWTEKPETLLDAANQRATRLKSPTQLCSPFEQSKSSLLLAGAIFSFQPRELHGSDSPFAHTTARSTCQCKAMENQAHFSPTTHKEGHGATVRTGHSVQGCDRS